MTTRSVFHVRRCLTLACAVSVFLTTLSASEIDFAHDVVPILKKHCSECHTGSKSEGGFSFSTQHLLLDSGYAEPGKPDASRLIELVESVDPEDQMPPADKDRLSPKEITVLRSWIAEGVSWESGFRFGEAAWEPPLAPRSVELPPAEFAGQNAVDRIINQYLKDHNRRLSEPIDDERFLRRASLDLIGLLPTIEEQDDFHSDVRRDRRQHLLHSLLGRNHDYAEHWMTLWNDLLRNDYAGTGYIDGGRKQISQWLYRSLLENKPYDLFVRELVAPAEESAGFINGIKWRGNVNASQVREIQFSQNVSQVFLGINMKCASCHDSFIDRWTLDEAYALAAVYSTRELEIHRCDKPSGRIAQAGWIFPELGNIDPDAEQPERLKQLGDLLTSKQNGRFARTIVNRLWHRLMGRGIVHPVDAMHTQPWNEDLLDYLANYLVEHNYDLKKVIFLITSSRAYQSEIVPAEDSATSAEYTFTGPTSKHLTAEQFLDAVWQLTNSSPGTIDAPIPGHLYNDAPSSSLLPTGKWIWTYADIARAPAGEQAFFRREFSVPKGFQSAAVVITCDNEYSVSLNGAPVGADKNWPTVEAYNITPSVRAGKNVIDVVARNAGNSPNAAALYAEIVILDSDNKPIQIGSDDSWLASREIPNDDTNWRTAALTNPQDFLGPDVRQSIINQLAGTISGNRRFVRAAMMKSNMLMRSLGRPNREQVVTTRPESLSTLQAIDLANGEILDKLLANGARQIIAGHKSSPDNFIRLVFRQALTREPSREELILSRHLLGAKPTVESVQDLLWTILMLPEFQFVE